MAQRLAVTEAWKLAQIIPKLVMEPAILVFQEVLSVSQLAKSLANTLEGQGTGFTSSQRGCGARVATSSDPGSLWKRIPSFPLREAVEKLVMILGVLLLIGRQAPRDLMILTRMASFSALDSKKGSSYDDQLGVLGTST